MKMLSARAIARAMPAAAPRGPLRRHLWSRTDEQEIAERKEQPASPPPTANTGRYTNTSDKVNERTETEDADAIDGPLKSKGRSGRETLSEEDVRADKAEDPIKR